VTEEYTHFDGYLLLKHRSEDALGALWRAGEVEGAGFKRIVWLRCFDGAGIDRRACANELEATSSLAQLIRGAGLARNLVSGSARGVPYLAWDYVPAQPLDLVLAHAAREQFPFAIDNALLIVEKLANALVAAAAMEFRGGAVVHGFLVPSLILLGNDGEAVVTGFGLARGLLVSLSRDDVRELAAPYLSPEVLAKAAPGQRDDVYSLAAILYRLLCGHPLPVDPVARAAALANPQMSHGEGAVPDDVVAILRKGLSDRAGDRPETVAQFKRGIEELLYGGAYSPTTFNLALFMDRLYRSEIEQEDRELQRERALDVRPLAALASPQSVVGRPGRRVIVQASAWIAFIAAAGLLAGSAWLYFKRPTSSAEGDRDAQRKILQEIVNTQVAEAIKEKEKQLRAELEAEKARTDQLRAELERQQRVRSRGQGAPAPDQQRLQSELAAREAEQRRKEDELTQLRQQRDVKPADTAGQPAEVPKRSEPPLSAASTVTSEAKEPPAAVPLGGAAAPATATATGAATAAGELVEETAADVPPEVLVEEKITLPSLPPWVRSTIRGSVIMRVLVNEKGGVDDVQVLRKFQTPDLGVDEACVAAARKYRFRPASKNGVPVKTWTTVTKALAVEPRIAR
jgi:TonB family protein